MKQDHVLKRVRVLDTEMAYRSEGEAGPVALFLHGNPTSSFIWRKIIPLVANVASCIAPDLVGFGMSGKPPSDYRFVDHVRYLDAFVDELNIESAYLIAQDWGTALAFNLAARRPELVRGLAFMEFIRPSPTWADFHQFPAARETFQMFRRAGEGQHAIIEENAFLRHVLPNGIVRSLTDEEMQAYYAPFPDQESRLPIWRLPNEMPIAHEPADVWNLLTAAHAALRESTYPKLLFAGDPGALISPNAADEFAAQLHDCQIVHLGAGKHYLQEDHPEEIGEQIAAFIGRCEDRQRTKVG